MQYEDDNSTIFVAKNIKTGLYLNRALMFLMSNQPWIDSSCATIEEVKEELEFANQRDSMWVEDMNDADIWSKYTIEAYEKYLTDVVFIKVNLSAA